MSMAGTNLFDLGATGVERILENAQSVLETGFSTIVKHMHTLRVVGTFLHNAPAYERAVAQATAARLYSSHVDLSIHRDYALSDDEILSEIAMASSATDLLLTSYTDPQTFGDGRRLTEKLPSVVSKPMISLADDIYAHQSALAELASVRYNLDRIEGRRIVICWGFGSRFVLPRTPHSLLILGAMLGAEMRVAAPPGFSLVRRAVREARRRAKTTSIVIEEVDSFEGAFEDADAVFALNWGRLDNFNHPERNAEDASPFKDWFLTGNMLPKNCLFATEPPVQDDLIAGGELLQSNRNVTPTWLRRRVAVLAASILHVIQKSEVDVPAALV